MTDTTLNSNNSADNTMYDQLNLADTAVTWIERVAFWDKKIWAWVFGIGLAAGGITYATHRKKKKPAEKNNCLPPLKCAEVNYEY